MLSNDKIWKKPMQGFSPMKLMPFLMASLITLVAQAADCTNGGIHPSTNEDTDLIGLANGTVKDVTTGLQWMRCSVGQVWNVQANSCEGEALVASWDKLILIGEFNRRGYAGKTDWRLPNINELRSITEDCRSDPAINTGLFPNTPSLKYWSASPFLGSATSAWVVDFSQGRDNVQLKNDQFAVRLVRVAD